jgi:hypothetical protein
MCDDPRKTRAERAGSGFGTALDSGLALRVRFAALLEAEFR